MAPSMKGSENPKRLDDKVVVITGANTGIGKETAKDLSKRGARVILLCRNEEKTKAAIEDIKKEVGEEAKLEFEKLDLSSLKSVRECAERLNAKEEKIDILINNAGVMACPYTKTEDGFELQFGTNHLGHFLLTQLLLPLIEKSKSTGFHPRIVIVSSMAHTMGPINWDDLQWERSYGDWKAYAQSKLANVLHAKELAKRVEGISVYTLHPGAINTELQRHVYEKWYAKPFGFIAKLFFITPVQGAQTTLYCALDDEVEKDSGKYYDNCKEKRPHNRALDEESQKKLWDISEKLVGLKDQE